MTTDAPPRRWPRLLATLVGLTALLAGPPLWRARRLRVAQKGHARETKLNARVGLTPFPRRLARVPLDLSALQPMAAQRRARLLAGFADLLTRRGDGPPAALLDAVVPPRLRAMRALLRSPSGTRVTRDLERAVDLAHLTAGAALREADPRAGWRQLAAALELPGHLQAAPSGPLAYRLQLRDRLARPGLATLRHWLGAGRYPPPQLRARIDRALVPAGTLERRFHRLLADLMGDVEAVIEDGSGRLRDDYLASGGTPAGWWWRRGRLAPVAAQGIAIVRETTRCLRTRQPVERLAQLAILERRWQAWLTELRTHRLYRLSPHRLLVADLVHQRRLALARLALALASRPAPDWPAGLGELAAVPLDPLDDGMPVYRRVGDGAEVGWPARHGLPAERWTIGSRRQAGR